MKILDFSEAEDFKNKANFNDFFKNIDENDLEFTKVFFLKFF